MAVQHGVCEFKDDDGGYLAWLSEHRAGFVLNITRSYSAATAKVHRAECRTINGKPPRGTTWTGPYVKVCADSLAELDQKTISLVGKLILRCRICHPTDSSAQPVSTKQMRP